MLLEEAFQPSVKISKGHKQIAHRRTCRSSWSARLWLRMCWTTPASHRRIKTIMTQSHPHDHFASFHTNFISLNMNQPEEASQNRLMASLVGSSLLISEPACPFGKGSARLS